MLPEPLRALGDLATNLRWSWNPETQDVFAAMDPDVWRESGHDPVKTLGALTPARLAELAADRSFLQMLEVAHADLEQYLTGDRWFQRTSAESADGGSALPKAIAYFSPEYGITSVLPQYSGGLGILAGDHLKTASDLGIPLIGVGLLYRHGYFRQQLSREGWQQETYPVLDPDGLPITLLREADGSPAQVRIAVPGEHELAARIFVAQVGRVPLLLLDTDVEDNPGPLREVDRPAVRRDLRAPSPPGAPARRSAASAHCARTRASPAPRSPRSSTPTRATPASSASSASAS